MVPGGNVNVYTDTGRVPYIWLRPVILTVEYDRLGEAVPNGQLHFVAVMHMVAAGTRVRMEATFERLVSELGDVTYWEVGQYGRISSEEDHGTIDLTLGANRRVRPRLAALPAD
jgi:hypothetical protein